MGFIVLIVWNFQCSVLHDSLQIYILVYIVRQMEDLNQKCVGSNSQKVKWG